MKATVVLFGLWTAAALAQSFTPPLAGVVRDSRNQVRRVHGIAGNFLVSSDAVSEARSAAFSGRFGLLKSEDSVITIDQDGKVLDAAPAPAGDALFAFDREGVPALAYFPETREVRDFKRGETRLMEVDGVVGLGVSAMLVFEQKRLWLRRGGGTALVSDEEFEAPPPSLLLADGTVIHASGAELIVTAADGGSRRARLDEACLRLEQMSDGWVQAAPRTALRLADLRIYRLPEVTQ